MKNTIQMLYHLRDNAPSYLKGVEIVYEDAEYCLKLIKYYNKTEQEACECTYQMIADILGIEN